MWEDLVSFWLSVDVTFLMDCFEVLEELFFNIPMIFQSVSLLTVNLGDVVMHSPLDGNTMEEFCIPFTFL